MECQQLTGVEGWPHRSRWPPVPHITGGQRRLGLGKVLATEMPFTRQALRAGRITEWKATILAREPACLSRLDRAEVDRRIASDPGRVEAMGDRELEHAARSLAQQLDVESAVLRRRVTESERQVTLRPLADTMCRLNADLPVVAGVAVFAALAAAADRARSAGDPRSRGQAMADFLVERVVGAPADLLPVAVELVVSDDVLFGEREDSARVTGYGPMRAELARELAKRADQAGRATVRRIYTRPETGALVAMDSRARCFRGGLAQLIRLRDQTCRAPWCDAPIRHLDHIVPVSEGGTTTITGGQGLCQGCNHAKQAPGWSSSPAPGDRHTVQITTPTSHTYHSTAPPPPGTRPYTVDYHYPLNVVA